MTPIQICLASEISALDQAAIEQYGVPESILMENAGGALAETARLEFGAIDCSYFIACGLGNNGGDGLVAARRLACMGAKVSVLLTGKKSSVSPASAEPLRLAEACGVPVRSQSDSYDWMPDLHGADFIIDAIFGTGLSRDITGPIAELITKINESPQPVIACDIPSGIDGSTGQIRGCCVEAEHTVTFGLPKVGNLINEGVLAGGVLHVASISYPPKLLRDLGPRLELNLPASLPPRDPNGHKGSFGQVLVIAGAANYFGAPFFSGAAFLSAGGGYARLCIPKSLTPVAAGLAPELVFHPQDEDEHGGMTLAAEEEILALSGHADCVVLGPGLSLHAGAQSLVRSLFTKLRPPLILDGDGLTALIPAPELLEQRASAGLITVLTPHLGEMARLTGQGVSAIMQDPVTFARNLSHSSQSYVVLKSARTIIASPSQSAWLNVTGNSGLGSPGTGDLLTGVLAARLAQVSEVSEATCSMALQQGVFIHGLSGDFAAQSVGEDGTTATRVLENIALATRHFRDHHSQLMSAEGYAPKLL